MISTGIVRKVDELGRIVIPMELRRTMGIDEKDPMEVFVDGEKIILKKYQPGCSFCSDVEDVQYHWNKPICKKCINELKSTK